MKSEKDVFIKFSGLLRERRDVSLHRRTRSVQPSRL